MEGSDQSAHGQGHRGEREEDHMHVSHACMHACLDRDELNQQYLLYFGSKEYRYIYRCEGGISF